MTSGWLVEAAHATAHCAQLTVTLITTTSVLLTWPSINSMSGFTHIWHREDTIFGGIIKEVANQKNTPVVLTPVSALLWLCPVAVDARCVEGWDCVGIYMPSILGFLS